MLTTHRFRESKVKVCFSNESVIRPSLVTGAKTRAPLNHWQRLEIHGGLCALLQVAVSIDIGKQMNPKQKQELNRNLFFPNLYNRN